MNSRQAHLSLLAATECNMLLASKESIQLWHGLQSEAGNSKILAIPDLEYFLAEDAVENYPFGKSWEEFKNDPILIMHTSGTTGKFLSPIKERAINPDTSQDYQSQSDTRTT
jgi:long-subunit acyl-CoA synthetase (AMP-forming)